MRSGWCPQARRSPFRHTRRTWWKRSRTRWLRTFFAPCARTGYEAMTPIYAVPNRGEEIMLRRILRVALPAIAMACIALAADISGAWQFTVETAQGSGSPTFEFKQDGDKLSGTYSGRFGTAPISGTVKGNDVEFTF